MKKHLIYLVSILIFSIILCGAASAANINVNTTTGIQNAINTASPGDTLNFHQVPTMNMIFLLTRI